MLAIYINNNITMTKKEKIEYSLYPIQVLYKQCEEAGLYKFPLENIDTVRHIKATDYHLLLTGSCYKENKINGGNDPLLAIKDEKINSYVVLIQSVRLLHEYLQTVRPDITTELNTLLTFCKESKTVLLQASKCTLLAIEEILKYHTGKPRKYTAQHFDTWLLTLELANDDSCKALGISILPKDYTRPDISDPVIMHKLQSIAYNGLQLFEYHKDAVTRLENEYNRVLALNIPELDINSLIERYYKWEGRTQVAGSDIHKTMLDMGDLIDYLKSEDAKG